MGLLLPCASFSRLKEIETLSQSDRKLVAQTLSLCFFLYLCYPISYQFGWHCEVYRSVYLSRFHLCRAINGLALETPMRIKASNDVGTSVATLQACTLAASQLLSVSILQACTLAKRWTHPHASCLRSRDVGKSLTFFQLSRILNANTIRDLSLAYRRSENCPRT